MKVLFTNFFTVDDPSLEIGWKILNVEAVVAVAQSVACGIEGSSLKVQLYWHEFESQPRHKVAGRS